MGSWSMGRGSKVSDISAAFTRMYVVWTVTEKLRYDGRLDVLDKTLFVMIVFCWII